MVTEIGYWFVVKQDYDTGLGDSSYTLSEIRRVYMTFPWIFYFYF